MSPNSYSVRCSSLPLVRQCPASALPAAAPAGSGSPEADLGTAFHALIAAHVRGREVPHVPEGVDAAELEELYDRGRRLWSQLDGYFPDPFVELTLSVTTPLPGMMLSLSGHPDLYSIVGDEVRVLDWKTGWSGTDYSEQMKGYGFLCLAQHSHCSRAYVSTVEVRTGFQTGEYYTREQITHWLDELAAHIAREDYRPGSHCGWCPKRYECQARMSQLQQTAQVAEMVRSDEYVKLLPDLERGQVLTSAYARLTMLERWIAEAKECVKADVAAHGGSLPVDRFHSLTLVERPRETIDADAAWQTLWDYLGEDVIKTLSVSKGDVEKLVKARAARGRKHDAWVDFMNLLREAGAVKVTMSQKLEVRENEQSTCNIER